jgi:hypothetical protein
VSDQHPTTCSSDCESDAAITISEGDLDPALGSSPDLLELDFSRLKMARERLDAAFRET